MYSLDDTIAAISTPLGEGGIGIVRLSGPEACAIVGTLFRPRHAGQRLRSYHLHYGHVVDPTDGTVVDEVLVSIMCAPHSYTRQDVAEINCHGGVVPLRRVLQLALTEGARLAEPGELTMRAFLNGRLDLAQAEAVVDIVKAKTDAALRMAVGQLNGRLSAKVQSLRERMLGTLAYLEATIDFVEDEVPHQEIDPELAELEKELSEALIEAQRGLIYRQGIRVAIVGRPNVGKSSLLNALLGADRAIVTHIPGTTRDTLEESLNLRGIPLTLVDTAGICESQDLVERLGVERSRKALSQADLVLLVVDASEPIQSHDHQIAQSLGAQTTLLVLNKRDLPQRAEMGGFLPQVPRAHVSALTGEGIAALEETMVDTILSGRVLASQTPLVSSPRHQALLKQARSEITAARATLAQGLPNDFVAIDITQAVAALGQITGQDAGEDLLDAIFANFCLGK